MKTIIKTDLCREFIVDEGWNGEGSKHLTAVSTSFGTKETIESLLTAGEASQIGLALLGENSVVVTDLPEVKRDVDGWVFSGSNGAWETATPEKILKNAKELLAVHAFLVKRNAEQEEAKRAAEEAQKAEAEAVKAKEAARKARREEICQEEFTVPYRDLGGVSKRFVNRIIDLEEAAKVS